MSKLQNQLLAQRVDILILYHKNKWKMADIFILLKEYFGYVGSYKSLTRFIKANPLIVFLSMVLPSDRVLKEMSEQSLIFLKARKDIRCRNRRSSLSSYRTSIMQKYSKNSSFRRTHDWFIEKTNISISYSAFRRYIVKVLF
jgi:hypothetical protein